MNILVVSENFIKGGLETQINTYYELLKNKHNFYFAFSKYEDNGYLKDAKISKGFNFSSSSSIKDFINDVNKLVKIIKDNNIDVIHAHPFYSFFPSLFAANLTGIKFVYSYHGYVSMNFISNMNDTLLFMHALDNRLDKVFCASNNIIEYFEELHNKNAVYIPNIIDEKIYKEHKLVLNKKWALISRLDNDKYPSIIKFLSMLDKLDIDIVDIYGSGSMENNIKKFIKKNKLENKVFFKGFTNQIYNCLDNYNGTIGIGRVTLESLCMNYPSILIGYNKVVGIINKNLYNDVKNINFVPAALNDISIEEFNKELNDINLQKYDDYLLRKEVVNDFGTKNINKYVSELESIKVKNTDDLNIIFNEIKNIKNKNENFYTSLDVFTQLYFKLTAITKNPYFKIIANNLNKINELNYKNLELNIKINNIKEENDKINEKLKNIEESLSLTNSLISNELEQYRSGKLYKLSSKVYSCKSKISKKKKEK